MKGGGIVKVDNDQTIKHKTETPGGCSQRMPCITNTESKHHQSGCGPKDR